MEFDNNASSIQCPGFILLQWFERKEAEQDHQSLYIGSTSISLVM